MSSKNSQAAWNSHAGYVWAMIGSAVGLANILGFSSKCYMNGGAAFLVPLFISLFVLGLPVLALEGVTGNLLGKPLIGAARQAKGRLGAFLGWPTILGVLTIGTYYTVINGWTIVYTILLASDSIPSDTEHFFFNEFLHASSSINELGSFSPLILLASSAVCLFTLYVNVKSVDEGIEKLNSFFLPLLSVLLLGLSIFTMFLPGAMDGLRLFFIPDFSALNNPQIWLNSFGHVFFSLSIGLGIIIGYSKYTDSKVDVIKSMRYVILGDILTSVVAGAVVFGGLGYMAQINGQAVEDVVTSSIFGTGFIVIPKICQSLGGFLGTSLGVLFFACLVIAGLSSQVSIVETVAGNLEEEFQMKRKHAVYGIVFVMFAASVMYSFGIGIHLIDVMDSMTAGFNVLIAGLVEIYLFAYCSKQIANWPGFQHQNRPTLLMLLLKYIAPVIILIILTSSLIQDLGDFGTTGWIIKWSWFALAILLSYFLSSKATSQT